MTKPEAPPIATPRPTTLRVHGDTRTDEYAWLRDREDPETIQYLEAENAFTDASLAHLEEQRAQLYEEIKARIVETDLSVPVRRGPYWYYTRTREGLAYPIHCRRPAGASSEAPPLDPPDDEHEEVLFDENAEAEGHAFFEVGILSISPDHSMLAVGTDVAGDERYRLSFRRIGDGPQPTEVIEDVSYGFTWAGDSKTAFYTVVDEAWRPYQLWRHEVGTDPAGDALVLQEDDQRFNVGVGRSRDEAIIVVTSASSTTTETSVLRAEDPSGPLQLLEERRDGVEHGIEHVITPSRRAFWLKVTNEDGAVDFRIDAAEDRRSDVGPWSTILEHRAGVRIDDVDAFRRALVISERAEGETLVRVVPIAPDADALPNDLLATSWEITSDERPQTTWLGQNPEYDTPRLRIGQTSMVSVRSVAEVELETRAVNVLKQEEVRGGYDPRAYVTYRTWATAPDGAKVPVSVVHRRDLLADPDGDDRRLRSPAPCLLYGYGAYEISIDPTFSSMRLSLLDRGAVYAIAHVRGGGELGRRWYDQGHLEFKHNSFDDFAAVADHLIAEGIADPAALAGQGRSAGGLLIGAVANRSGDRFCALCAEVPFVDALNSMLDPSLPLTVGEYEEWGNPTDDPKAYDTIKAYAPYENVIAHDPDGSPHRYPPMLLTGGLNDTRVGYWEPAKLAARLRSANVENPVLLRTEMGVGHGGPSGRYDAWRDEVFTLSWLLDRLGVL